MRENLFSLPENWQWTTLGIVCKIASGNTPSTKNKSNFGGKIPWITPSDLSNFNYKYISKGRRNITKKGLNSSSAAILPAGTVIFSSRAPIGYVAIAKNEFSTNQGCKNFIPKEGLFNEYLYYYLKGNKGLAEKYASGTTFLELSAGKAAFVPISLPPLPEQHKIVERIEELFTKLDAGVEALKKVKEQIKQYRQSVLKSVFEGKLTADFRQRMLNDELGILNEKKDNLKSRIDNSELKNLPELPKGWEWTNFERIGEVNPRFNKNSFKTDLEVTFLPMRNVKAESGKIDLSLTKKLSYILKKSYTYFGNGDILFAKITPCMENGKVAIADGLKNGIGFGSTEFHVIRLSKDFSRKFFFYYIIQEKFRKEAERNMKGTAGHMRVPTNYIKKVPIVFPPLPEQQKIVEEIEKRFSIADEVEKTVDESLKQAEKLRQSILKKAFEGKLTEKWRKEHPELVSGENSAEKLLEKIKAEKKKLK
jgi:type I restriction enzyme S subunit